MNSTALGAAAEKDDEEFKNPEIMQAFSRVGN